MKTTAKSLVIVSCALVTMLLLLWLAAPRPGVPSKSNATPAAVEPAAVEPTAVNATLPGAEGNLPPPSVRQFYFDVQSHSPEDFYALLQRALTIYEQTPAADRDRLEVVMVLHGPDINYFDAERYIDHQNIVDLAAKLDAFGVFDFKACAVAASRRGLDADRLPAFIEFVPFGPGEIERLEEAGFVRL